MMNDIDTRFQAMEEAKMSWRRLICDKRFGLEDRVTSWQVSWLSALTEATRKLNWVHDFKPSLLATFPVQTSEAALLQAFKPYGKKNIRDCVI